MASVACFVGLDYSDDRVQVCLLDRQGNQVANRLCGGVAPIRSKKSRHLPRERPKSLDFLRGILTQCATRAS